MFTMQGPKRKKIKQNCIDVTYRTWLFVELNTKTELTRRVMFIGLVFVRPKMIQRQRTRFCDCPSAR